MISPFPKRRASRLKNEINIVPYLDVMLVLLVIFMVTAPLITHSLSVKLPETDSKQSAQAEGMDQRFIWRLSLHKDRRLYLASGTESQSVRISEDQLREKLAQGVQDAESAEISAGLRVIVLADESWAYGEVLQVLHILQDARVKITLQSVPKTRK